MRKAIVIAALMCGGCVTGGDNGSVADAPPPDYRAIIAANKASLFKDPSSIRDAAIGPAKPSMFGWQACLKANAKNSFGGYTGLTTFTAQIYRNGNPPVLLPVTIYDGCGSDYYTPFAELNGDYVPPAPVAPPIAAAPAGKPRRLSNNST